MTMIVDTNVTLVAHGRHQAEAADALLSSEVLVEERVDGANLGLSVDDFGRPPRCVVTGGEA